MIIIKRMEDIKTIIKELSELELVDKYNSLDKSIIKENLDLFSSMIKTLPDNIKKYMIQYKLGKVKIFTFKIQLLMNKDFINIFTDNSNIISEMILYIITHFYPEKRGTQTQISYLCGDICKVIEFILTNKKVQLQQEDYKLFHEIAKKYLHGKCDDVSNLFDIITNFECEDELFNN
jgi:hypothetical protein